MNAPEEHIYESPLAKRAASHEMLRIWSEKYKFSLWRTLWFKLASVQKKLGLNISQTQLDELASAIDKFNPADVDKYEQEMRHDVMAHIKVLGEMAPSAKGIIHLGATGQFVVDNCDTIRIAESLDITLRKIKKLILLITDFAIEHKDTITLGLTHFQPAQPTTVGKRAAMWAYDIYLVLEQLTFKRQNLRFRGAKGVTGTQASYLELLEGNDAVDILDQSISSEMGFNKTHIITGQVYPRISDAMLFSDLAALAASCQKTATDIRLLAGKGEMAEDFGPKQVGSSAMPYKRNPLTCEKVCGLSKLVIGFAQTGMMVASEQWLERSLDDSSARRVMLPESFLAIDGILESMLKIFGGLTICPEKIKQNLIEQASMLLTEKLLMIGAKSGADRQELHEKIRRLSLLHKNHHFLLELQNIPEFSHLNLEVECIKATLIGRAVEQVEKFAKFIDEAVCMR